MVTQYIETGSIMDLYPAADQRLGKRVFKAVMGAGVPVPGRRDADNGLGWEELEDMGGRLVWG